MMETGRRPILQGEYKLVKVLERFDYSTLYLAVSIHNPDRKFTIKQVRLEGFESLEERNETMKYFREVASPYVELMHPGLTTLKDFFYENEAEYIVFEHVPGHRLSEVMAMRNRPFTETQAVDVAMKICEVMDWLHTQPTPLYFADLNPANVLVMQRGKIKLTDFGLGKVLAPRAPEEPRLGTRGYAPPEQCGPDAVISRTNDIYALGALMHHMVTGQDPTKQPGVFAPICDVNPAISEDFAAIVATATHPDPSRRYVDVKDLVADLKALAPERRSASQGSAGFFQRLREMLRRPFVAA